MSTELLADFLHADETDALGVYGIEVQPADGPPVVLRMRSDDRVNLYSVAKGFTSVAAGLAEAEGRLTTQDPLLDHFPELRPLAADGFEEVTLHQSLTMTSGTSHAWFADQAVLAPDLLTEIVAAPLAAKPGTRFNHTGSGPYAVGRVIARATGANLRDDLQPRVFTPMGLPHPPWHTCPLGHPLARATCFCAPASWPASRCCCCGRVAGPTAVN